MRAPRRDSVTEEERALIDRHIAERGVTRCPTGAMATGIELVWRTGGDGGALVRVDGRSSWDQGQGAFFRNRARAARLRAAERGS